MSTISNVGSSTAALQQLLSHTTPPIDQDGNTATQKAKQQQEQQQPKPPETQTVAAPTATTGNNVNRLA